MSKIKNGGLNPSNSSNLEQLALNELKLMTVNFWCKIYYGRRHVCRCGHPLSIQCRHFRRNGVDVGRASHDLCDSVNSAAYQTQASRSA